jgi:hypothetical protein
LNPALSEDITRKLHLFLEIEGIFWDEVPLAIVHVLAVKTQIKENNKLKESCLFREVN